MRAADVVWVWPLAVSLLAGCARSNTDEGTDGATHFLAPCASDAACESGYTCLCGVCSFACEDDDACQQEPGGSEQAICIEPGVSCASAGAQVAHCRVACEQISDCAAGQQCAPGGSCVPAPERTPGDVMLCGTSRTAEPEPTQAFLEGCAEGLGAMDLGAFVLEPTPVSVTAIGTGPSAPVSTCRGVDMRRPGSAVTDAEAEAWSARSWVTFTDERGGSITLYGFVWTPAMGTLFLLSAYYRPGGFAPSQASLVLRARVGELVLFHGAEGDLAEIDAPEEVTLARGGPICQEPDSTGCTGGTTHHALTAMIEGARVDVEPGQTASAGDFDVSNLYFTAPSGPPERVCTDSWAGEVAVRVERRTRVTQGRPCPMVEDDIMPGKIGNADTLQASPGPHEVAIVAAGDVDNTPLAQIDCGAARTCPEREAELARIKAEYVASQACLLDWIRGIGAEVTEVGLIGNILFAKVTWQQAQEISRHPDALSIDAESLIPVPPP